MIRYEAILKLTLDAESQHDAAVMVDEVCEFLEDHGPLISCWPRGDTSLRPVSISWPVD